MNAFNYFLAAALSILPSVGLWIAVRCSPLIPHLMELLVTRRPMTEEDVENHLMAAGRWKLLNLYLCVWCQAMWTAVLSSLMYCYLVDGSPLGYLNAPLTALMFYPITTVALWKIRQLPNR